MYACNKQTGNDRGALGARFCKSVLFIAKICFVFQTVHPPTHCVSNLEGGLWLPTVQ